MGRNIFMLQIATMKNILVPTDFSATALNAAHYALQLAKQLGTARLVLYHAYQAPMVIDPMVPVVQFVNEDQLKRDSQEALEKFKLILLAFCPKTCVIETYCEYALLNMGLDEACAKTNSDLIIMGITGGGILEEKLVGSNTLSVAKHTKVPLIIVPANSQYTGINRIMLASDFDKADTTIPVELLKKIITETNAKLIVFNIEEETDEYAVKYPANVMGESYAIYTLLQDLKPEYKFSTNTNYTETINQFVLEYQVDMVITIPKKHGFFERLFSPSHTKMLAFHSHVPVMIIHE